MIHEHPFGVKMTIQLKRIKKTPHNGTSLRMNVKLLEYIDAY